MCVLVYQRIGMNLGGLYILSQQQAPLDGALSAAWSLDWRARRRLFGDPSSFNSKPQYLAILPKPRSRRFCFVWILMTLFGICFDTAQTNGCSVVSMDELPFAQSAERDGRSLHDWMGASCALAPSKFKAAILTPIDFCFRKFFSSRLCFIFVNPSRFSACKYCCLNNRLTGNTSWYVLNASDLDVELFVCFY